MTGFAGGMVYPLITTYLTGHLGMSATAAGLMLALRSALAIGGGPVAGPLTDSWGRKPTMTLALAMMSLTMLAVGFTGLPVLATAALGLNGLADTLLFPPINAMII
ncbi:MAG: MFS transporter, partial [Actinobacteria bacterium]|nr:MFS transporter [Actinomycetota bacterium]